MHPKQAKLNTREVSVKYKDRLQLSQDSHKAWTRPRYGGQSIPTVSQHPCGPSTCPWRWERKSIFSDLQILWSFVFSPLRNMFYFLWKKKKVNIKAKSSQNNFANVCPLLPFKPIKYLSLTILSIQIWRPLKTVVLFLCLHSFRLHNLLDLLHF